MKGEGTLLEKARKVPVARRTYETDPEILEAAIAWLKGEVKGSQLAAVWGIKQNAVNAKLLGEIKNAARQGRLKLELVP